MRSTTLSKNHLQIALGVMAAVFFIKVFYIFHFTAYETSVQHDMAYYWQGAFERAWGNKFSFNQYGVWPPFFIYLCAYLLRFMNGLGMLNEALPLVIVLNVLLHSISLYFFYLIINRLTGRKIIALGALLCYALSYTQLYLNALILPENLATPLLVIVIWIIAFGELNLFSAFGAGLLLGIAIAAKPIFIILSLVFVWHLFSRAVKKDKFIYAFALSIGLVLVPLVTVVENYHVSRQKVLSLSAAGGVNFFQGWSRAGLVTSKGPNGTWWLYSPGAVEEPSWKPFFTNEPWYHQGYFYRKGIEAIVKDPRVLLYKVLWFKKLFWGYLAPGLSEEPEGYHKIMPAVGWGLFIMFLFPWILFLPGFRRSYDKTVYFFFSILSVLFFTIYLCGMPERRYLSYVEFLIIILFFIALDKVISLFRAYKKEVFVYCLCLFSFVFIVPISYQYLIRSLG